MSAHDQRLLPLVLQNLQHPSSRAVPACSCGDADRSTATTIEAGTGRERAHPSETPEAARGCAARAPACLPAPGRDVITEGVSAASRDGRKAGEEGHRAAHARRTSPIHGVPLDILQPTTARTREVLSFARRLNLQRAFVTMGVGRRERGCRRGSRGAPRCTPAAVAPLEREYQS